MRCLTLPAALSIAALASWPVLAQSASPTNRESRSIASRAMDRIPTPIWRTPERSVVRDPSTGKPLAIIEGPSGIVDNDYIIREPNTGRVRGKIGR